MFRKRQAANAVPPMSAMIDVVFLLLIFFVVTHHEQLAEAHVTVNAGSPGPPAERQTKLLTIVVPPDSALPDQYLLMGSSPIAAQNLADTLAGFAILDPKQPVVIKINPKASQAKLITLLDHCTQVGLTNVNLLTLKE